MSMLHRRLINFLLLLSSTLPAPAAEIEQGELNGAKFTLARPAQWNRRVLLIAHGYRPEGRPLVADLFPEQLATRTLLDEGWIIVKTSYRRNGIVVRDAIADLDALNSYIISRYGAPERVLLEGESMGGLIVTLLAERGGHPYAGAIAIGAALEIEENGAIIPLTRQPKIPLLFLTNQNELAGPENYTKTTVGVPPELQPALLRVSRDGHVNVNQRERLAALRALNAWLDAGRAALPRPAPGAPFADATVAPAPLPSQVAPHADARGFDARITEVSAVYGNVFLNAQPADFAAAGINPMTWFQLTTHGKTYRTFYGRDFGSVPRGEWVVFPNADGYFWLSRNYADAAGTAGLSVGDTVIIERADSGKP